jgi:tetratricopeptide (TPR) repeat protein
MAFAQLAEEYRRAGANDDAVTVCRAGLAHHPDYLSARVTLGRALVELGRLEEAQAELAVVLRSAPDNLAANRGVAEIYRRRGQLNDALMHYKIALQLARHDPELERAVQQIQDALSPPPPPKPDTAPIAVEDLFDFDTLLEQLGGPAELTIEAAAPVEPVAPSGEPQPILAAPLETPHPGGDPLAVLEQRLRESDDQRGYLNRRMRSTRRHNERVMARLQSWLDAIVIDRRASA